ncbi:hypothetical protein DIPPA_11229 [Diplonema papillatum]|nr:hypothetical protein DIPPA_11229 [Diplonema papillatum]
MRDTTGQTLAGNVDYQRTKKHISGMKAQAEGIVASGVGFSGRSAAESKPCRRVVRSNSYSSSARHAPSAAAKQAKARAAGPASSAADESTALYDCGAAPVQKKRHFVLPDQTANLTNYGHKAENKENRVDSFHANIMANGFPAKFTAVTPRKMRAQPPRAQECVPRTPPARFACRPVVNRNPVTGTVARQQSGGNTVVL